MTSNLVAFALWIAVIFTPSGGYLCRKDLFATGVKVVGAAEWSYSTSFLPEKLSIQNFF